MKAPTRFIAHSSKLKQARIKFEQFMLDNKIVFNDPKVPIISNNNSGIIVNAAGVKQGLLAMVDEPMDSQNTLALCEGVHADCIVEFGRGPQTTALVEQNLVETPFYQFNDNNPAEDNMFKAVELIQKIRDEVRILENKQDEPLNSRQYDLLRSVFLFAKGKPFFEKMLFSYISDLVVYAAGQYKETRAPPLNHFIEVLQNSYLLHFVLKVNMITPDTLAVSTVFKKRILANDSSSIDKIDIELSLLDNDNIEHFVTFSDYKYPESIVFDFKQLPLSFADLPP